MDVLSIPSDSILKSANDIMFFYINNANLEGGYALLIEKEVDINMKNNLGYTPLLLAVRNNNYTFVNLLLEFMADPNTISDEISGSETTLTIAAENNYYDIASVLLDYGANPNEKNKLGYGPLHLAAKNGHLNMILLLITRGADPNLRDSFGNNAAYLAKKNGHMELLQFLPNPACVENEDLYEYSDQVRKQTKGYLDDEIKKYQNQLGKELKAKAAKNKKK